MSKQFTYAIDEQSLRGKLTNMSAPLREDAWSRFDSYAVAHARPVETNRFKSFNIQLSRATVLPAAFAMIIIFFSFLLFNFISINPKKANLNQPVPSASVPFPQVTVEPLNTTPLQPQTLSADITNQVAVKTPEAAIVKEPVITQESKASVADESMLTASNVPSAKKRRPADVAGATHMQEIRPTIVTEDMDPEVRPN
jgi:hypothetical protein